MDLADLRDPAEARRFLLQGLWLQRLAPPSAAAVGPVLGWALEAAAAGQPLPPSGFLADLGHAALGHDPAGRTEDMPVAPGLPPGLLRTYEDHVLGKLYADWTFARAGEALRRYRGRDQARGLAFVLQQFRARAAFAAVEVNPAAIKAVLEMPADDALRQGWESLQRDGADPLLVRLYESLLTAARRTAEVLGPEDVFELEHGTALKPLGERLALRQVLQASARLEAALSRGRPRLSARRPEVPTNVLDEDTYPVGGFAALSTRGSVESLLHSQLALMENHERPDLFDIKFLRDELLYYSRDENQFLRRRHTFVFALFPDLVQTRVKDPEAPWQRGVLLLGLLLAAVRRLTEWLSADALVFEFWFLADGKDEPLAPERALLEVLLREQVASGTARLVRLPVAALGRECALRARRSLCHCLAVAAAEPGGAAEATTVTRLRLDGPVPAVDGERPAVEDVAEGWGAALQELLRRWVG